MATLGPVLTDHPKRHMEFYLDNKQVQWIGDSPNDLQQHYVVIRPPIFCLFLVHEGTTIEKDKDIPLT